MRRRKELILEGMSPVVMMEMTPIHFPGALKLLSELYSKDLQEIDTAHVVNVVNGHFDELSGIIQGCSNLSLDQFKELGGCDLVLCIEAWVEANSPFFDQIMTKLAGWKPSNLKKY